MFELFDHTADLGLRAIAPTAEEAFADIARALTAALVETPEAVEPRERYSVRIDGTDREYLLYDFLCDLLHRFEAERFLLAHCAVSFDTAGLSAELQGEPADESRHPLSHEVKAITLHGLRAEQRLDGSWLAEAIIDI